MCGYPLILLQIPITLTKIYFFKWPNPVEKLTPYSLKNYVGPPDQTVDLPLFAGTLIAVSPKVPKNNSE